MLDELVSLNGVEPTASEPEAEKLPRVDVQRGVFITSGNTEIELSSKPITSLMLERISSQGKPAIPRVEVLLLGKHREMQANPKDPGYLALLAEWEENQKIAIMRYVFVVGAKGQPPPEFVEEQRMFFPDATDLEMKYLWVASRLPDEDIDVFTEAVLGRGIPTEKGLRESAATFRSEDQRDETG